MSAIIHEFGENIATLTLNNPKRRNSLSQEILEELVRNIESYSAMGARVIILRAPKGSEVWSAGFDIRSLPDPGRDPLGYNDDLSMALRAIQMAPCPVIAMIEGSVWGGACDIAMTCDMAIGAHNASFAITPAKLGVPYNTTGLMRFVNAMGIHIAKEMFFTGQPITGQRAHELGILNHLVSVDELEDFTLDFAKKISANSPLTISVMKEQLRMLGNSYMMNPDTHERIQGLRRQVYDSHDYREGKQAFLEKRSPTFIGK